MESFEKSELFCFLGAISSFPLQVFIKPPFLHK